ncbi:MAG TPA: STAS domain-containing protein [Gemmatimonadaceae bacterium]|nr:STAS domain-containing protein [Gemmatimonadaceae bacterium]
MTDPYLSVQARGTTAALARVLDQHFDDVLADWLAAQANVGRGGASGAAELRRQGSEFMSLLRTAVASGASSADAPAFGPLRGFLDGMSRGRAQQGYSPSETATFVFALKGPVFARLSTDSSDTETLAGDVWGATQLLDSLGLYTTEVYQRGREEVIHRQQQDMLELSTPVVMLWDGVLALPMIGTLDSARTQVVMETLLQRIVETGADIAILDITGVPTVDTLTAQHLLKTVTAARLMGAECIISGIRPQIAQTIVHLGVDLGNVTTKASLADAFRLALQRTGRAVVRVGAASAGGGSAGALTSPGGQAPLPPARG